MPKIVDHDMKRQEIIEKAKEVFARVSEYKSFPYLGKMWNGRTTLYQYFANKDEIFYQTMRHTLEEIRSQVEAISIDEELTITEKLKRIVHQLIGEGNNNHTFLLLLEAWLVLKREKNETLERLKEYIIDLKLILEILINKGIESKEIKQVDSKSLAETIYTLIETFTLQRTSNNIDIKAKIESFNLLIDGLKV